VWLREAMSRPDLSCPAGVDGAQHADVSFWHPDAAERVLQRGERHRVVCPSHIQREQVDGLLRRAACFTQSLDGECEVLSLAIRTESQVESLEHLVLLNDLPETPG